MKCFMTMKLKYWNKKGYRPFLSRYPFSVKAEVYQIHSDDIAAKPQRHRVHSPPAESKPPYPLPSDSKALEILDKIPLLYL